MVQPAAVGIATTGITGRIPIQHERHPEGFVDVTPDVIYTDDLDHGYAICDAIEVEHYARRTHPLQLECDHLNDVAMHPAGVDPQRRAQHQAAHQALREKMGDQ